jgi:SpoVK/Ycf46/Vps4 family AAA+-type ATPase
VEISAAERLSRMIGVDKIRERLYEIIGQIEFARQNQGVNAPAMHMRFVGNPGTGKTTIARIVGQLLKERKILSRGYFFEHNGGDFLGMYVGHTAPKTLALCRDAYGSVLFIDEAYTLADANYSDGGYAKEAVDTLIAQMENHREDLVVIMAGYPNEMARLMNMNPGL